MKDLQIQQYIRGCIISSLSNFGWVQIEEDVWQSPDNSSLILSTEEAYTYIMNSLAIVEIL